jgi:hypothetical protein
MDDFDQVGADRVSQPLSNQRRLSLREHRGVGAKGYGFVAKIIPSMMARARGAVT